MKEATATAQIITPIGMVELTADRDNLVSVRIDPHEGTEQLYHGSAVLDEAVAQMRAYFARERQDFDLPLLPLATSRGNALREGIASVPYGETRTYGALARQIDSAPRAVGQACKRNPFPIIIPCHRITTSAGPENYSGGAGIATKAWLNDFEQEARRLL